MENYAGVASYAYDSGVLPSFLDPLDRRIPMIAVGDVGRLVADTLPDDWSGQRVVKFEGPQRYAPNDVAAALTDVLGRSVKAEILPRGQALFGVRPKHRAPPRRCSCRASVKRWSRREPRIRSTRKDSCHGRALRQQAHRRRHY
jgi:NAD(P)H dehydrogenase (quinone)